MLSLNHWNGVGVLLALVSQAAWSGDATEAHQFDQPAPFSEPQAPETLARLLFGPRYRSASPGLFAMQIRFDFDSDRIRPESLPLLDSVGDMLHLPESAGRSLIVEGHTDSIGSADYNQTLSERRARAVIDYLADSHDIDRARLTAAGKGERELYDRAQPKHAVNRRAVFRATQKLRLK